MVDVVDVEVGRDRVRHEAGVEQPAGRVEAEVGAGVAHVEAHAAGHGLGELGRHRAGAGVELAPAGPEGVGDDVAVAQLREQRGVGDRRRVREPAQVDHDRLVGRERLRPGQERAVGVVAHVGGPHLEAHDHVGVRLQRRGRGVEVEVPLVVRDAQLVADEVAGRQVQLVGVDERQHPGRGRRGLEPGPGQAEGGDAAGAPVDHHRDAGLHPGPVGGHAEVAEAREHVGVGVDEAGGDHQPPAVDLVNALTGRPFATGVGAHGEDPPARDHHVADDVDPVGRVEDAAAPQHQSRRRRRGGGGGRHHTTDRKSQMFPGRYPPVTGRWGWAGFAVRRTPAASCGG